MHLLDVTENSHGVSKFFYFWHINSTQMFSPEGIGFLQASPNDPDSPWRGRGEVQ